VTIEWNDYVKSIFLINTYLKKFIESLNVYANKFGKLKLVTELLFNPINHMCKACVPFIKRIQSLPDHANLYITTTQALIYEVPDEVRLKLDEIRLIPDDRLGPSCNGAAWESNSYFNQINLNIVQQMKRDGDKLTTQRYRQLMCQFTQQESFMIAEHVVFLRQTLSYTAFCARAVGVLANMTPDNNNCENVVLDEPPAMPHFSNFNNKNEHTKQVVV